LSTVLVATGTKSAIEEDDDVTMTYATRSRDVVAGKLWTAPEILRENNPPRRGTQRGDVYSFAIVCYEIMMRTEPFNFDNITPRGACSSNANPNAHRPTLRLDLTVTSGAGPIHGHS